MKTIDINTKALAVKIVCNAFSENPSMNWFLNKKFKKEKAMQALCEYCIDLAIYKGGAFISNDDCCVCLIFKSSQKTTFIEDLKLNYLFINKCCGWTNLFRVLNRSRHMKKNRAKGEHLYAFLLASSLKCGNNSVIEARNFMYDLGDNLNLPIYAETCLELNKRVYERYGFETYYEWKIPCSNTPLWFLKREPQN